MPRMKDNPIHHAPASTGVKWRKNGSEIVPPYKMTSGVGGGARNPTPNSSPELAMKSLNINYTSSNELLFGPPYYIKAQLNTLNTNFDS